MKNQSLINLVLSSRSRSPPLPSPPSQSPTPVPFPLHFASECDKADYCCTCDDCEGLSLPPSLVRSPTPSLLKVLIRTANECGTFLTVRFRYRVRRHRQAPGVRARRHDRRRRRGSGEIEGGGEERRGMAAAAADCHMLPYCGEGGE